MFCVEPVYLRNSEAQLQYIKNRVDFSRAQLDEIIARLNFVEMKGMDAVRRDLRRKSADLAARGRELEALIQALSRIVDYYTRTEQRNERMFERIPPILDVWERINLRDTIRRIPKVVIMYGTDGS